MPKTETTHRFPPHPNWVKLLSDAWDRLADTRGAKSAVLQDAGVSKSTQNRVENELDKVGHDSLEALRLALNKRLKMAIPPPVFPMRSADHYEWCKVGLKADETGDLERLMEWADLGRRLAAVGVLSEFMDVVRDRVEAEEALAKSNDRLSAPIRKVPEPTSERPGKPRHHGERQPR